MNSETKSAIQIPGVDFNELARQAIAGKLTEHLLAAPAIAQKIVADALAARVDSEGKNTHYSNGQTWLDWAAAKLIREVVFAELTTAVAALRPAIEKQVRAEVRAKLPALTKAIAQKVVDGVNDRSHYGLAVEVKLRG